MLGRHTGDIAKTLSGVRLALLLDPPERAWPQRCKPFAQPALDAMYAAWRSSVPGVEDQSWGAVSTEIEMGNAEFAAPFLAALQHFWTDDPAPTVPVAPSPAYPRVARDAKPFVDREVSQRDVTAEAGLLRLDFGELVCTIDVELHATCLPAKPMETGILAASTQWTRTYGGRVVSVDKEGTVTETQHGRTTKNPTTITMGQRSTRFVDDWVLWKDTHDYLGDGKLMVMNLAGGASAKPEVLGALKRPTGGRTYGVCRDAALFVDMDPKVAVLSHDKWTLLDLEAPLNGRHIDCRGDTAIVAEWAPPSVRRCDARGCTLVTLPPIAGTNDDELASDGDTFYQIERRDPALVLAIQSLSSGSRKVVPIADSYALGWVSSTLDGGMVHSSRGRVFLTLQRKVDSRPIVLAVERDGSTRVLVAGE
jgi:hypothetical protein